MSGNVCPLCGKAVMPYSRFLREAEPYKVSPCGSCGANLRRSPVVWIYLLVMMAVVGLCSFLLGRNILFVQVPVWVGVTGLIVLMAGSVVLINYLAWRFVGWVPAEKETRAP